MFITSGGYRAKALTRRICITIKSFFVPHSQQDRKHLSLFLYRAKNLPCLLFHLQIKILGLVIVSFIFQDFNI